MVNNLIYKRNKRILYYLFFILSFASLFFIEYKKNITKIKSEGNLTENEEEAKKPSGFFSTGEDSTLGMDALTIIW